MKCEISNLRFEISNGSVTQQAESPVEARDVKVRVLPDPCVARELVRGEEDAPVA